MEHSEPLKAAQPCQLCISELSVMQKPCGRCLCITLQTTQHGTWAPKEQCLRSWDRNRGSCHRNTLIVMEFAFLLNSKRSVLKLNSPSILSVLFFFFFPRQEKCLYSILCSQETCMHLPLPYICKIWEKKPCTCWTTLDICVNEVYMLNELRLFTVTLIHMLCVMKKIQLWTKENQDEYRAGTNT